MLVLTRQRDQIIMLGDDIEVAVVDIRGDKVRLGITAPKSLSVHRKEVWEAIRRENQAAATLTPQDIPLPPSNVATPVSPPQAFPRLVQERDEFMQVAYDEAQKGLSEGGLPIGSVLVRDRKIIGRGHNQRVQQGDPMAHAEINCLTNAGRQKTYRDTVLYSTLMPCFLCSGAVVQFGVPKVIAGESANFKGAPDFLRGQGVEVVDLHDAGCIDMMRNFVRDHPDLWHEDIGK